MASVSMVKSAFASSWIFGIIWQLPAEGVEVEGALIPTSQQRLLLHRLRFATHGQIRRAEEK